MFTDDPWRELSPQECWELLAEEELGRLAYTLVDEISIVPINYGVDRGTLLFRTAEGTKLFAVVLGADVAFEVDRIIGDEARSVVVRGAARRLEEDEEHRADGVGLRPWVGTPKYDVVEIVPMAVTGRAFRLSPHPTGGHARR